MREIKFRAWNTDFKPAIMEYFDLKESIKHETNKLFKFQDKKLMQYTGLEDKNGVEIYEGDIVKPFPEDDYAQIIFMSGTFKIASRRKNGNYLCWKYMKEEIEVIGNIYENPELL